MDTISQWCQDNSREGRSSFKVVVGRGRGRRRIRREGASRVIRKTVRFWNCIIIMFRVFFCYCWRMTLCEWDSPVLEPWAFLRSNALRSGKRAFASSLICSTTRLMKFELERSLELVTSIEFCPCPTTKLTQFSLTSMKIIWIWDGTFMRCFRQQLYQQVISIYYSDLSIGSLQICGSMARPTGI